jgi:regulator of protease activity HflC (stomatin/prohibitin superfamily)
MKYLIWIIILAMAVFLIYSFYFRQQSAEEAQVTALEKAYRSAEEQYVASARQMGTPGLVVIADPEIAIRKIKDIQERLAILRKNLKEQIAIAHARRLEEKIALFCQKNEID